MMTNQETFQSDSGKAKAGVVLVHGLTGMPSELRPIVKHLTKLGYVVETPILPGHGAGHTELLKSTWKDWLRCVQEAVDALATRYEKVFVGGLSMGAILSAAVAAQDPRVSGIIVMSPTLKYDGVNTSPYGCFLWLVDILPFLGTNCYWTEEPPFGLMDERLQKQIIKSIEAAEKGESDQFGLFRTYAGSLRQMDHLVKIFRKKAKNVKCPALFIHSLQDTITTPANTFEFCGMLGSRDKTVHLIGGCDHVLTLDLRRKDVCKFIGDFVMRLAPLPQTQTQTQKETLDYATERN
jgi:carboxylesterase